MRTYFFIAALSFLTPVVYGQQSTLNTSTATASATIVTEMLGVEKLNDINFENIQVSSSQAVELQYDVVKSNNGFMKIIGNDYEYSITIPSTEITVQKAETLETMKIGSFIIDFSTENYNDKTLFISANLNANSSQANGTYTSTTPLTIIVNNN